jgi:hypothetical protein
MGKSPGREFVALFLFDNDGILIEGCIEELGSRQELGWMAGHPENKASGSVIDDAIERRRVRLALCERMAAALVQHDGRGTSPRSAASVGTYGITATSVSEAVLFAAADLLARPHILKDFRSAQVNQSGMQSPMAVDPCANSGRIIRYHHHSSGRIIDLLSPWSWGKSRMETKHCPWSGAHILRRNDAQRHRASR